MKKSVDELSANATDVPELLAPAGDWDCARAAIENGADAIYFGLDTGFNARARAHNFGVEELPELMRLLHRRGLRGYVTFNTLVFPAELARAEEALENIAAAGVDAVLVQDLGIARLARQICPQLEVHASTQMTLTSAETIEVAKHLGVARVVLARELSIDEIRKIRQATEIPIEVFVHGALCVAYSGQCLTSESLGGRSANRGQCAQACRLPYELVVDNEDRDLGEVRYLLSPQDLAAYPLIDQLIDAGVCSLKIEGRLKTPEYVANITQHYRQAIDQAVAGKKIKLTPRQVREMELSFSRGFSPGWLQGCDHKMLVPGDHSAKRGVKLGEVISVKAGRVGIRLSSPVARGDGIVFTGDRVAGNEIGGRVFEIYQRGKKQVAKEVHSGEVELVLGPGKIEIEALYPGQAVWKNDDPQLNRRLRETFTGNDPIRRTPVDLHVRAVVGQPLEVQAVTVHGQQFTARGEQPLEAARRHPVSLQTLHEQFDRLGGTPFRLLNLTAEIVGDPMVPHSLTGILRRELVEGLTAVCEAIETRTIDRGALVRMIDADRGVFLDSTEPTPVLAVLCRREEHLRSALDCHASSVYVDYHDFRQYRDAVALAREAKTPIFIAPLRIQKPGEFGLLKKLASYQPDGFLVRNLASLQWCRENGLTAIADFSLNVANQLTAAWLLQLGAKRLTVSYDLNRDQLEDLMGAAPVGQWEVVIHQHMPMFHMEHCVFCSVISPGTNKTNCGRPCDRHQVRLRDRIGMEHPLQADIGCRNTLFNAVPQSAAEVVPDLIARGLRAFRIELLENSQTESVDVIRSYQRLLRGEIRPAEVWQRLKAANRVGVTRGTLEERRNPLAIL